MNTANFYHIADRICEAEIVSNNSVSIAVIDDLGFQIDLDASFGD